MIDLELFFERFVLEDVWVVIFDGGILENYFLIQWVIFYEFFGMFLVIDDDLLYGVGVILVVLFGYINIKEFLL